MNNTIKFLFFNILLCAAPAMQAMGSVRNFGARAFKVLASQQYNYKTYSNVGYKWATAGAATLAVGCLWNTYDSEAAPKLRKHDYNASLPEELKNILDSHAIDIDNAKWVNRFDWFPGWIVKSGEDRIEGAKLFSTAITELGYSNLIVPEKYHYISPSGKNYTISKLVKPSPEKITLEELKQLLRAAKKLQWVDPHGGNITKTSNGKIALIDTKMAYINALNQTSVRDKYELRWVIFCKMEGLRLNDEAREYLESKKDKYLLWHVPAVQKLIEKSKREKLFFSRLENHLRTCSAIEN